MKDNFMKLQKLMSKAKKLCEKLNEQNYQDATKYRNTFSKLEHEFDQLYFAAKDQETNKKSEQTTEDIHP